MAEDLIVAPEAIPLTVYQNDDRDLEWYPFGTNMDDVPENFADYDYAIDVWQGTDFASLLLTSEGDTPQITKEGRDNATGKMVFRFPREVMLAFVPVEGMRYDVREIDPDDKEETIYGGVFTVIARGSIVGT